MTKTTINFENCTLLNEVRELAITNLKKVDDPEFVKAFTKAYNTNRCNQVSKYGKYSRKADVTASGYLKIAKWVKAVTEIKGIKVKVAFKLGGVNLSGDTKPIRDLLKSAGFSWNHKTSEWYNQFGVMAKLPAVPEAVELPKPEPKAEAKPKTKAKKGEKKLADSVKVDDPAVKVFIFEENKAKVKAKRERKVKAVKAMRGETA